MIGKYPLMSIAELEAKGAILAIQDGNHGEKHPTAADYVSHGIPFVMANDLNDNFLDLVNCHFITEDTARRLRIGFSKTGDVLLTHKGTLGNVVLVKDVEPFIMLTPQVTYYRTDNTQLLNRYLVYAFREPSFQARMRSIADQGTRPYIGIRAQRELRIVCPEPLLQRRIAEILANYDDLIDNNRRRMALLEESARLLYREWFVRLRFPGYEHTRIVDGLPEGWERKDILEFGTVITGKTPSTKEADNYGGNIPFIKTPNMHNNLFVLETDSYLTEKGSNTQAGKLLPEGALLVSCIGTVGVVSITAVPSQFNQQINALIPKDDFLLYYCYFAFKDLKPRLESIGGGVTMANVSKGKFESLDIAFPIAPLLRNFDDFCRPIFFQIKILMQQNQKLRAARDLLLPRLMSGEIAV